VAAEQGKLLEAASLQGAAEAVRQAIGRPMALLDPIPHAPMVAVAREALREEAIVLALEAGPAG
jgi:hypothetical protein